MNATQARRAAGMLGITPCLTPDAHHWSDWTPTPCGDGTVREQRVCVNCGNVAMRSGRHPG